MGNANNDGGDVGANSLVSICHSDMANAVVDVLNMFKHLNLPTPRFTILTNSQQMVLDSNRSIRRFVSRGPTPVTRRQKAIDAARRTLMKRRLAQIEKRTTSPHGDSQILPAMCISNEGGTSEFVRAASYVLITEEDVDEGQKPPGHRKDLRAAANRLLNYNVEDRPVFRNLCKKLFCTSESSEIHTRTSSNSKKPLKFANKNVLASTNHVKNPSSQHIEDTEGFTIEEIDINDETQLDDCVELFGCKTETCSSCVCIKDNDDKELNDTVDDTKIHDLINAFNTRLNFVLENCAKDDVEKEFNLRATHNRYADNNNEAKSNENVSENDVADFMIDQKGCRMDKNNILDDEDIDKTDQHVVLNGQNDKKIINNSN